MAAKHILSLEIPSVTNCDIFSVKDTSQYAENLPIECPELLITPPGFNAPYMIEVQPGFDLNLTPCALGLQTYNCDQSTSPFPDGVYTIGYRVQPHEKVFVQYHYLRVTEILKMYHEKLCELDITPCEPTFSKKKLLSDMRFIRTMVDAAKAKVEYANNLEEGLELYNFAYQRLLKITCDNSSC
jgi:hypothetical protein|tara:strand:+ start:3335 stop:3886 length:552 start_codon:yes stop_codon:yes gene_type:complete